MDPEYARQGKPMRNVGETLQANWLSLSLVGVGVAWLVASNTGVAQWIANDQRTSRRNGLTGNLGIGGEATHRTSYGAQIVGPDGRPLRDNGGGGGGDGWVSQATDVTRQTLGSVREAGASVLDEASRYAGYVRGTTKRTNAQVAESLQREPWLIGVAGMIAGMVLAVLLPPTQIEQDYVAEIRDQLWTKANDLGHQAAARVRALAEPTNR